MKAVIMAGGFGTRLRPLTSKVPKPMVPVANRPIMEWILELLKKHKLEDITTILYHQPEEIRSFFGEGETFGVNIDYVTAEMDFGTAGAVKNASKNIDTSFIVISGDILTDFDLSDAMEYHKKAGSKATILLTRVENPLQYGIVFTGENNIITKFLEKPTWGEVFSDYVNTGIYIFEPEILEYIPTGREFDFSRNLFPLLMKEGVPIYGYQASGYWRDIGDLSVYRTTHREILEGVVDLDMAGEWLVYPEGKVLKQHGSVIEDGVHVEGVNIVGRDSLVKTGASIVNSVIGDDCVIERGSNIRNTVVWHSVTLGDYTHTKDAIVASGSEVGERSFLMEETVISEGCVIGKGSTIRACVKLWPDKNVEEGSVVTSSLVWGGRWQRELFSESRITGISNYEINPEFAAKLGSAMGSYLGQGLRVVTARDTDRSSHMVSRAIMAGLLSAGINISHLRTLPVPLLSFAVGEGEGVMGIYVRRSPFDRKLSDILFFDSDGISLSSIKSKGIERVFSREDYRRVPTDKTGTVDYPYHIVSSYRNRFLSLLDRELFRRHPLKIVLDYSYSPASEVFPVILSELECEVIGINAHPYPEKSVKTRKGFAKALLQLSGIVSSIRADLGVLMDSGGEKIFLVDDEGTILNYDQSLHCYTYLMLEGRRIKRMAFSVASSDSVKQMCEMKGVDYVYTADTGAAMMEAAASGDIDLGVGRKGGYIFPSFMPVFDAMFSTAKLLEQLAASRTSLSGILKKVPSTHLVRENLSISSSRKGRLMRKLMERTSDMDRTLIDGIKVRTKNGWVLVRPDSYRPIIHLDSESDSLEGTENQVNRFKDIIAKL